MESVGSFEKTRAALAAIKGDIASAIAALGGHDQLVKLVEKLDAQVAVQTIRANAEVIFVQGLVCFDQVRNRQISSRAAQN